MHVIIDKTTKNPNKIACFELIHSENRINMQLKRIKSTLLYASLCGQSHFRQQNFPDKVIHLLLKKYPEYLLIIDAINRPSYQSYSYHAKCCI